uniref:G-protein coupled receptors family 1 profile domain-containing protein n=1 Tax=Latimeria chalumnae TaxID=7897 RepID=H3AJR1_LATCH
ANKVNTSDRIFISLTLPASIALAIFMICCNVLILRVLLKKPKKTSTALAMISMGVADTLLCILGVPMVIFTDLNMVLPFYSCLLLTCAIVGGAIVSSFHQVLIAMQRWYMVTFPTRYKGLLTHSSICLHIALCWIGGIFICLIPVMGFNSYYSLRAAKEASAGCRQKPQLCRVVCAYQNVLSMEYMVYIIFYGCVMVPLLLIALLYAMVFKKVKAQNHRSPPAGHLLFYQKEKRMVWTMTMIVLIYAAARLPFNLVAMVLLYCRHCRLPFWMAPSAILLAIFSTASNPFMYFFRSQEMRTAWRKFVRRKRVG